MFPQAPIRNSRLHGNRFAKGCSGGQTAAKRGGSASGKPFRTPMPTTLKPFVDLLSWSRVTPLLKDARRWPSLSAFQCHTFQPYFKAYRFFAGKHSTRFGRKLHGHAGILETPKTA